MPGDPLLVLERVDGGSQPRDDGQVAVLVTDDALRLPRLEEQVDGDRGLIREEPEELHLLEAEERLLGPVENREDAECSFLVEERRGHQPLRDVARALGDVAREARIVLDVLDDERRSRRENPAGDSRACGKARAEERVLALADDRFEDELLGLGVEEQDRRRLRAEDRARDLDDRGQKRPEGLLRADDACGHGSAQIGLVGHVPPPTLVAVR